MIRTAIYGSCVGRDTYEYLDKGRYSLTRYIARQSLISAFSPPIEVSRRWSENLESPFRRQMLEGDFEKSFRTLLASAPDSIDLLLWDLTDERLGVYEMPGGTYLTRSLEAIHSGLDADLQHHARHIPFGGAEHRRLWLTSLGTFTALVDGLPRKPTILLVAPRWAVRDDLGHRVPNSFGLSPRRANVLYRPYLRAASALAIPVEAKKQSVETSHKHPWGVAPFHYTAHVYEQLAQQISAAPLHA